MRYFIRLLVLAAFIYGALHLEFQDPVKRDPSFMAQTIHTEEGKKLTLAVLNPQAKQELYGLMSDIQKIMDQHQIPFWVSFGTLLGAVRHGGLIPWDDDLDISIWEKDQKAFMALAHDFKKQGITLDVRKSCMRLYRTDGRHVRPRKAFHLFDSVWFVTRHKERFPYCDVHMVKPEENKTIYANPIYRRDHPGQYYLRQDLDSFKKVPFGPLQIPIPQDPSTFLTTRYGPRALVEAVVFPTHGLSGIPLPKEKILLTPQILKELSREDAP